MASLTVDMDVRAKEAGKGQCRICKRNGKVSVVVVEAENRRGSYTENGELVKFCATCVGTIIGQLLKRANHNGV